MKKTEIKNHKTIRFYVSSVFCVALLIMASACVSSPQSRPYKGIFISGGRVEGLDFISGHKQGTTDSNGIFYFNEGDTVTFYLGGVIIGFEMNDVDIERTYFSPFNLVNDEDNGVTKKNTIINITRLLETLDDDGDYTNGIRITKEVKQAMAGMTLSFNVDKDTFKTNTDDLINQLNASGILNNRQLVLYDDAKAHLIIGMINDEDTKPPAVLINLGDDWVCGTQSGFNDLHEYTQVYGYAPQLASVLGKVFEIPWSNPLLDTESVLDTESEGFERSDTEEDLSDPYNLGVPGATVKSMVNDVTDASDGTLDTVKFMNELFKPLYDTDPNLSQLGAAQDLMEKNDVSFINIFTLTVGNNDVYRAVFNQGEETLTTSAINDFLNSDEHNLSVVETNLTTIMDSLKTVEDSYVFISNLPDLDKMGMLFSRADINRLTTFDDCDLTGLPENSYLGFGAFKELGVNGLLDGESSGCTELNDYISSLNDEDILSDTEAELVKTRIYEINSYIGTLEGLYENVIVVKVDINELFNQIENEDYSEDYTVTLTDDDDNSEDYRFRTGFGGGVFSLDGLTPSYTGYALVANKFIETIRDTLANALSDNSNNSDSSDTISWEDVIVDMPLEDVYEVDPYRDIDKDGYVKGYNLSDRIPEDYVVLIDANDDDAETIAPFSDDSSE